MWKSAKLDTACLALFFVIWCAAVCFIFSGCKNQPPPKPAEPPKATEPAKPAINDLAQIEEMAMAADGEEFIAHPPTIYRERAIELFYKEEAEKQYRKSLATWAETARKEGRFSEADKQACIDKWANMSKIELRKQWQARESLLPNAAK